MNSNNIQIKRAITYGFLALVRDSMKLFNSTIDVFIPLVKKGMVNYCQKNTGIGNENISVIGSLIKEEYAIDIPNSVLRELLRRVEMEINDDNLFKLHKDNSFILKSFTFYEFEDELLQAKNDAQLIQRVYDDFCSIYNINKDNCPSVIDFIDNNRLILSSYISIKDEKESQDYTIAAQFVEFCKQIPLVYKLLCNQYLGSVITCYLEYRPQSVKIDVDLLLDTNFVISLLDLNTAESTETCHKLLEITKSLGYSFHVLKDTIEEIQSLLSHKIKFYDTAMLYKYINKEDIYGACERRGLSIVDLERISDNLEIKIQEWGIQIVYNTDNLTGKAKYSKEYSLLKSKRNTDKAALHDAKAIYYVKNRRGKNVNTFEEANCWFVNNSITHDSDSDSIDALLNENRTNGLPEIIKADELLNIIWLSNPQINMTLANSVISEIGLTSLVSFTLNKSLPKSSIIRKLDDNIQKYRNEDVTDKDVLLLSTRIVNHHLSSDQVEKLNELSDRNKNEFSRRIKEEALKEAKLQKEQGDRLNQVITKWSIDIQNIKEGKIEIVQTVIDENKSLQEQNAAKDAEIKCLKDKYNKEENLRRKEKREIYVKQELRKWRKGTTICFIAFSILFLLGIIWIIGSYLSNNRNNDTQPFITFIQYRGVSYAFTILIGLIDLFIFRSFYDKYFLETNINSFKDHIFIPEELRELES